MNIESALEQVNDRASEACRRAGRKENTVRLVAVSKRFPFDVVQEAHRAGQRIFGESRAQELKEKTAGGINDIEWHFIGHLQTNKIKYVAPVSSLIHAVDTLNLAQEISSFAEKKGIIVSALLQVNTGGESSKYGFQPEQAEEMYIKISETMRHIKLKGLMCMAPFIEDVNEIRRSFIRLRLLKESLEKRVDQEGVAELSMGMSHDYEIAIEEGSTLIRVGTAIFGSRGRNT